MNAQINSVRRDAEPHQLHLVGPAKPGRVYAIPLPTTPLLTGALPYVDWSDAYAVFTPSGAPRHDPQEWADAIFHGPPLWIRALFGLREVVVRLMGIERGGATSSPPWTGGPTRSSSAPTRDTSASAPPCSSSPTAWC